MTTAKKLMTGEELAALPDDGRRYELLDGVLHEMPPTGPEHDFTRNSVAFEFTAFVRQHSLGHVLSGDTDYYLHRDPDRVRAPDVSIYLRGRLPDERLPKTFTDIIPDLVVEVVSPNDRATDVEQKALEWLAAGVKLVLIANPDTRAVLAYRSPTDVRRYADADTLDAEPVLPGFACPVARLFPPA